MSTVRIASIGECMLELSHTGEQSLALRAAGDTFNTAVYLAREAPEAAVAYVTVLGSDPYSDYLLRAMSDEGLDTSLVHRVQDRLPGAYFVKVDGGGERSFFYYRSAAAARLLFATPDTDALVDALARYDVLYLSGITLAILEAPSRQRLLDVVRATREAGGRIAFDPNYRSALWPDAAAAVDAMEPFLACTDFAFPGLDDERQLRGQADPGGIIGSFHDLGVTEVVLKQGVAGAIVSVAGRQCLVRARTPRQVVDTTAAGDAFNAAYLAARLRGSAPEEAADRGALLAAEVVGSPGAIIPRAASAT